MLSRRTDAELQRRLQHLRPVNFASDEVDLRLTSEEQNRLDLARSVPDRTSHLPRRTCCIACTFLFPSQRG